MGPARKPNPASMPPAAGGASEPSRADALRTQVTTILDRLDAADDNRFRNRRAGDRRTFRRSGLPVRVIHPGGSTSERAVVTRNLSPSGIGFLYDGYLHVGSRVELTIARRLGGTDVLTGRVVYCAHVGGVFHQIGVRFDAKIVTALYLDGTVPAGTAGDAPATPVDPASLAGRVLLADEQAMDRALFAHHLRGTRVRIVVAADLAAATEAIRAARAAGDGFGLVLIDLDLAQTDGTAVVAAIRGAGHAGAIAATFGERATLRREVADRAGAGGTVAKPFDRANLLRLLHAHLGPVVPALSAPPADAGADQMIARYVANVRHLADQIKQNVADGRLDALRNACASLGTDATAHGFAPIVEAARGALESLDATASIERSRADVDRLAEICRRVIVSK